MRAYLDQCRMLFVATGVFSFFINLLLLVLPLYMLQVFDRVLSSRSLETLLMLTLLATGAILVWAVLEMLRSRLLVRAGMALHQLVGAEVLADLIDRAGDPRSEAYAHGLRDVNTLRGYVTGQHVVALFDAPWAPFFLFVIYLFHPLFGAVAMAGMLFLFGLVWIDEKLTRGPLTEASVWARRTGQFVDAALRNADVIKTMGMLGAVKERWQNQNLTVGQWQLRAGNRSSVVVSASKFVRMQLQIVMLGFGAYLVIDQHLTPGIMMAATLILGRAMAPVERVIAGWKGLVEANNAYRRLTHLLEEAKRNQKEKLAPPPPRGRLAVERLLFGSNPSQLILKGVSFELAEGDVLGVVGPSGAGKSTLARLLLGIWTPVSGAVRLDGARIQDWDPEYLGRYLGYLPQDVDLFDGTVAENIARMGDAKACSEAVIEAAQRSFVHDMILRLPNGYDTRIGAGGIILSGGQRQRLALARALFGNPRLVVLDEPNSNLDTEGEMALLQALGKLKADGVTVVLITHKPSLLGNVDKILMLREGQVAIFGKRQEVLPKILPAAKLVHQAGTA